MLFHQVASGLSGEVEGAVLTRAFYIVAVTEASARPALPTADLVAEGTETGGSEATVQSTLACSWCCSVVPRRASPDVPAGAALRVERCH
jgi:hypothetical protein